MEELEGLLPVDVVELADVLDSVGFVVKAHGGADLAGEGLGAGVNEQVLLQGVVVPESLEADGTLGAAVKARWHGGAPHLAGRDEVGDLRSEGEIPGTGNNATEPTSPRPSGNRARRRQERILGRERGGTRVRSATL